MCKNQHSKHHLDASTLDLTLYFRNKLVLTELDLASQNFSRAVKTATSQGPSHQQLHFTVVGGVLAQCMSTNNSLTIDCTIVQLCIQTISFAYPFKSTFEQSSPYHITYHCNHIFTIDHPCLRSQCFSAIFLYLCIQRLNHDKYETILLSTVENLPTCSEH